MTTSTPISPAESLPIGTPSSPKSASVGQVLYREFSLPRQLPLPNTISLDSLLSEFESDAEMAQHMVKARQDMAATLYADESETLSALRLAAGLSQAQLAARACTTQPYIAKIERGQTDPGTDIIARIAQALGVDEAHTFRVIRNQLVSRGQKA